MKILFATSEAHPLIKTGGLADVSGSLPNALQALKHKVKLIIPAYQVTLQKLAKIELKTVSEFKLNGCGHTYQVRLLEIAAGALDDLDVPVLLVDIPELFDRPGNPYLAENGTDWWDNGERFGVFSKAVVEVAMNRVGMRWKADIVHANDWQTGLVPALLSVEAHRPKSVFTIHNMAYPGNFPQSLFEQLELPWSIWGVHGVEFWGHFSMLKGGLVFADYVTTVSPTYAKEITTWEFAYGFEGILQQRASEGRLVGILNGIDEDIWSPKVDQWIKRRYSAERGRVAAKQENKEQLLEELAILKSYPVSDELRAKWASVPLIGLVGRLVTQKGVDLVLSILPDLLSTTDASFVFVGSGEKRFESELETLAGIYPDRIYTFIGYSEKLAHEVEAGADMFLMPSRFEPCGLNQMYSLAYGTPPIVHHTGGLADTVVNATDEHITDGVANGFVFYDPSPHALLSTIHHAIHLFGKKRTWQKIQKNGMLQSFDWQQSAKQYEQLYLEVK